jgi:hypothetical protein
MVDFKKLGDKARDLIDKRGGTDSLKEDATELKDIATQKGSLSDKAKAAAAALKEPGAKGEEGTEPKPASEAPTEPKAASDEPADATGERAERKERRAERREERAERHGGGGEAA